MTYEKVSTLWKYSAAAILGAMWGMYALLKLSGLV